MRLLDQCANPFAVHSSKAIGEPPFFLATSAFLASKHAVAAARSHRLTSGGDDGATESASSNNSTFFPLWAPATSERLRMACLDNFTQVLMKKTCALKELFVFLFQSLSSTSRSLIAFLSSSRRPCLERATQNSSPTGHIEKRQTKRDMGASCVRNCCHGTFTSARACTRTSSYVHSMLDLAS